MKKYLLPLLLVVGFVFLGFNKANAGPYDNANSNFTGFASNPLTASINNQAIYGFQVGSTGGRIFTSFTITASVSNVASTIGTYFSGFQLYRNTTSDSYGGASVVSGSNFTVSGNTITVTIPGDAPTANGYYYYYIVANYTNSTFSTVQLALTGYTFNGTIYPTSGDGGPTYNVGPQPVTVTLNSLGTAVTSPASPLNGLAPNPLIAGQTNLPIYGFSLVGSGTGTTANITGLSFNLASTGSNYNWYTTMTLVSSQSSTYTAGAAGNVNVASYTATNTGTSADYYANFTGLNINVTSGATLYYFLVINTIANYSTYFEEDYSSSTGAPITSGTTTTGYDYQVTNPYLSITNNTTGINTTNPYYYSSLADVLESFSVTATNPGTFTSLTLKTYINGTAMAGSTYFTNAKLYSSTNPNYANDLSGTGSPLVPVTATISLTGSTVSITGLTGQNAGTTPIYYFIVGDFTAGLTSLPATFQCRITAAAGTITASGAAYTIYPALPAPYTIFNLNSDLTFGTATTTGLASTNLYTNQNQAPLLGFSVTTTDNQTVKQFTLATTVSNGTMATYFAGAKLYVNTTNSLTGAQVVTGATFSALSTSPITITGLAQNINNTTLYYFVEADYIAPTTTTSTFTISVTNAINTATTPVTYTTGAPITSQTYYLSPPVLLGTAATTGFASNPLVGAQTGIALFGFSVNSVPTNTFTVFNLTGSNPITGPFSNFQLYSSTTNNFTMASPVTDAYTATVVGATNLQITGLNQTITNSTVYYFIVVNYTPPTVGNTTFHFCLGSVATTTPAATYTNVTSCGTDYTVTSTASAPASQVYYWVGGSSTTTDWKTTSNWSTITTGSLNTLNLYPGSNSGDVAIFSATTGTQTKPTPTISALDGTITINTLTVNSAITPTIAINASSGLKLTTLNVGTITSGTTSLTINTAANTGLLSIAGTTTIGQTSSLIIPYGTVKLGSTVSLSGATSAIKVSGGTVNAVTSAISLTGASSTIALTNASIFNASANGSFLLNAGTSQASITLANTSAFNITSCPVTLNGTGTTNTTTNFISTANNSTLTLKNTTVTMSGNSPELQANNGTMNFYNTAININGTTIAADFNGISFNSGTINLGDGTAANASTLTCSAASALAFNSSTNSSSGTVNVNLGSVVTLSGNAAEIYALGGTYNFNSATVNLTGTNSEIYADYYYLNQVYFNVNSTTINLGSSTNLTTPNTDGTGASLVNTDLARFYLNAGSVINLYGNNTVLNNNFSYDTPYNSYAGGYFVAASTSVINPIGVNAIVENYYSNSTTYNAANRFTFLSDASGSATIGALGTGAKVTGLFNVQRYISAASRNYRLLSSATNSTSSSSFGSTSSPHYVDLSLLDQSASTPSNGNTYNGACVGGPTGTAGLFTITSPAATLYLYQESIVPSPTNYNSSFYSGKNIGVTSMTSTTATTLPSTILTTTSTAVAQGGSDASASAVAADNSSSVVVSPGNGYLLYYIHDNSSTSVTSAINATATTASGFINQGNIPLVLWGQSGSLTSSLDINTGSSAPAAHNFPGLTLVGNPYPSTIDLQTLYTDNTGTNGSAANVFISGQKESFSELDPTNSQFATYGFDGANVTLSGSDASRYIASGQGFYITVQNSGGLTFYEHEKTTTAVGVVTEGIQVNNPIVDNVTPGIPKTDDAVISSANTDASVTLANLKQKKTLGGLYANTTSGAVILNNSATVAGDSTTKVAGPQKLSSVPATTFPAAFNTAPHTFAAVAPALTLAGLHLKLVMDSVNYDECGLYFNKSWSDKFDGHDAADLDGTAGKVYLSSYSSNDIRTSINALGDYTNGKRVPLFVKFSTAGIFKMQLEDIANFNTNYSVFLIDKLNKDSLDLTLYKSYNFNYAPGTANDSTRFELAIEHKPIPHYALLAFAGEKVTAGVQLNWKTLNEENYTRFVLQKLNTNNTYLVLDSLQSDSAGAYAYVDQHPVLGNNTYRLQQTDGLGNITYSAPVTIGYNSTSPNGGLMVYPNPTRSTMTVTLGSSSIASQVATVDIYDISGNRVEHKSVSSNSFVYDATSYKLGVYIIELKNSSGVLMGKTKFVKVQ